jgi:hypothetical protein
MDGHLTSEDFRIILTEDGKREDPRLLLRHLAICRICYAVVAYLSALGSPKAEAKGKGLGTTEEPCVEHHAGQSFLYPASRLEGRDKKE